MNSNEMLGILKCVSDLCWLPRSGGEPEYALSGERRLEKKPADDTRTLKLVFAMGQIAGLASKAIAEFEQRA